MRNQSSQIQFLSPRSQCRLSPGDVSSLPIHCLEGSSSSIFLSKRPRRASLLHQDDESTAHDLPDVGNNVIIKPASNQFTYPAPPARRPSLIADNMESFAVKKIPRQIYHKFAYLPARPFDTFISPPLRENEDCLRFTRGRFIVNEQYEMSIT